MTFFTTMADFLAQKASLLPTLPVLIVAPVASRPKWAKLLRFARYGNTKSKGFGSLTLGLTLESLTLGLLTLGSLTLAGCAGSTYSGHFDCPLGEGARCASLSRVNAMIDRNEIDLGDEIPPGAISGFGDQGPEARKAADSPPLQKPCIYYGPGSAPENSQEGKL